MIQEEIIAQVYDSGRKAVPIHPTLVIGLGDYGRAVGEQLVSRLALTEESLRAEGLTGPLLVQSSGGVITSGFVRVMHLDWNFWFDENCQPDALLRDVELKPDITEIGTPPRQCEEDRHPDDWGMARQALAHPNISEVFKAASHPLRTHDNPRRSGHFQLQDRKQKLEMRVIVVCALREAASAQLGLDIVELLSKLFFNKIGVTRGIQIFCYVGGTDREEHFKAYEEAFGVASRDSSAYDKLLEQELTRILPSARCQSFSPGSAENFLDKLEHLWQNGQPPCPVESCYLIDSQLANHVAAVRQSSSEPDESIVVATLAITLFIASNADSKVRATRLGSLGLTKGQGEQGIFATLGASAYSFDHPRLRQVVYDYVVGTFLQQAQPAVAGDDPTLLLLGESKETVQDENLEATLLLETQKLCKDYKEQIAYKKLLQALPKLIPLARISLRYKDIIKSLIRLHATNIWDIQGVLEQAVGEDFSDPDLSGAIHKKLVERQQGYHEILEQAFQRNYISLFAHDSAPLIRLYRFQKKSRDILLHEAHLSQAPSVQDDLDSERKNFAENMVESLNNRLNERAAALKREMARRLSLWDIAVRALLIAPVLVFLFVDASLLPLQHWALFQFLTRFSAWPFWLSSLVTSALVGLVFYQGYRWRYHSRLRRQLKLLSHQYEEISKKADKEAWIWALTQQVMQRERDLEYITRLCEPQGVISTLRDTLLATQFQACDHTLERMFFDERMQAGLKEVGQKLVATEKLWGQHARILYELVSKQRAPAEMERWLRRQAEEAFKDESSFIIDLVEEYLMDQTRQRLEEIWQDLSNAAALFLQRTVASQNDPVVDIELFCAHNLEVLHELADILRLSNVEILSSVDRLRWLFTHIQTGLHLSHVRFAVEAQLP